MKERASSNRDFDKALDKVLKTRDEIEEDLQFIIESVEQYQTVKKTKRLKKIRIYSSAVAAIFVLGILMTYFLPSLIKIDSDEIFSTHYEKYIPDLETRNTNNEHPLTIALNNYQANEPEKAIYIINSLLEGEPNNQLYQFNNALFLTELERYDQSYSIFESLVGQSYMTTEALWYMALIDMRNENWNSAKEGLKQIRSLDKKSHSSEVRRILKKIWLRK